MFVAFSERISFTKNLSSHDEGAKMSFKIAKKLIGISLGSKYVYKMKKFVTSQNLVGLKIW